MTIEEHLKMLGECIAQQHEELAGLRSRLDRIEAVFYPPDNQSSATGNVGPAQGAPGSTG